MFCLQKVNKLEALLQQKSKELQVLVQQNQALVRRVSVLEEGANTTERYIAEAASLQRAGSISSNTSTTSTGGTFNNANTVQSSFATSNGSPSCIDVMCCSVAQLLLIKQEQQFTPEWWIRVKQLTAKSFVELNQAMVYKVSTLLHHLEAHGAETGDAHTKLVAVMDR